jgi:putative membrane protein
MFTTLLLASHDWHHHGHGAGLWFLFPLLVIVAVLLLVRWRRPWHGGGPNGTSVLAERFARGEIDESEYRARLAVLRERKR